MTLVRRPRLLPRGRAFWLLLVAGAMFPALSALAQQEARPFVTQGLLSGVGPSTTGVPFTRPYFLGWNAEVEKPSGLFQSPVEPGGVTADPRTGWVYVATRDGRLVCLDGGRERWSVEVGGSLFAPPTVWEDSVVVGTGEGVLAVLNKVTGARRVRAILGEQLITQPVVVVPAHGPARAYVGSAMDTLFAVQLDFGQKLWSAHRDQPAPFSVHGFARPVVLGGTLYQGFADGTVEALDAATGEVKWKKALSPPGSLVDVDALGTDGRLLFAASYSGGVYALEPGDGSIVWRTPMSGVSRLTVDGPRVLAVGPGLMQELRASDGRVAWKFTFGHRIAQAPVVTGNVIALARDGGDLYFVDARTGAPMGLFGTGTGFDSPPALNGQILFAFSNGGRLYSMTVVP